MPVEQVPALLFDCDGVILDSNALKTRAFHDVAHSFGARAATALVDYHVAHGGVSRYRKFEHFLANILHEEATPERVAALAREYAGAVRRGLLDCAIAPGLGRMREQTVGHRWYVVSGGDQAELRGVFAARGLDRLFDGGIHGSPTPKPELLEALAPSISRQRSMFFGDSAYDHECAAREGIPFVFVHGWSEMPDWEGFCRRNGLRRVRAVADALPLIMETDRV